MAGINVVSTTSSSVTLCLSGLDTSWNGATRTVYWYLADGGYPTENAYDFKRTTSISGSPSSGGTITFSGLESNTNYYICCMVYHGSNLLAEKYGEVTTDYGSGGGGGVDSPWYDVGGESLYITTYGDSATIDLQQYQVHWFPITFAYSGYAHFHTISQIDTYGYLSDSSEFNNEWSGPLYDLASDDDSYSSSYSGGSDFDIEYYVTAGQEYYLFVRGFSGLETGHVQINVTAPWKVSLSNLGTLTGAKSTSITLNPQVVNCCSVSFSKGGTVTFTTAGSTDTVGYLSTSTQWDSYSGAPIGDDVIAFDDDSGNNNNFSFSYNVTAGQVYYIWIKSYDKSFAGNVTLNISSAASTSYFKWSSAVAQGLPVKNVSHTEWDSFIDKIIEVITAKGNHNQPISEAKYGYPVGTTYLTMLRDCYLTYDTNLQGYPLTAKKFNVARFIIGSNVSTGISDKTSKTSQVLASDLIKLENCLKTWQS